MAIVARDASHEQVPPSELLRSVKLAEQAGFDAAMSSDHFSPWSERQHVGQQQGRIETFDEHVVPALRAAEPTAGAATSGSASGSVSGW